MIIVDETVPVGDLPPPFPTKDVVVKFNDDVNIYYDLKKEIGRGRFGTVYLCTCKATGLNFAAKFVNTKRAKDRENVEREIEVMKVLNVDRPHPKLIQLYDAFDMGHQICLVLEVVDGGELFERVIDDDFVLTERACAIFVRQICEGIEFMHSKNVLHLDMKPENILCLSREGNRVKICDFGLARCYDPRKKLQVLFGTPEFVAPEVVLFDPIGFSTDMWSVGVICYVLLSGLSPFLGANYVETMTNVTKKKYDFDDDAFDDISQDAKDFIEHLLILEKNDRLTPDECIRHQWIEKSLSGPSVQSQVAITSDMGINGNVFDNKEAAVSEDMSVANVKVNDTTAQSEEQIIQIEVEQEEKSLPPTSITTGNSDDMIENTTDDVQSENVTSSPPVEEIIREPQETPISMDRKRKDRDSNECELESAKKLLKDFVEERKSTSSSPYIIVSPKVVSRQSTEIDGNTCRVTNCALAPTVINIQIEQIHSKLDDDTNVLVSNIIPPEEIARQLENKLQDLQNDLKNINSLEKESFLTQNHSITLDNSFPKVERPRLKKQEQVESFPTDHSALLEKEPTPKFRPTRDVPMVANKHGLSSDKNSLLSDPNKSPLSHTPLRRSRRTSYEEGGYSDNTQSHRRPSRDIPLVTRIRSNYKQTRERIKANSQEIWPDVYCLSQDNKDFDDAYYPVLPVTGKFELPVVVLPVNSKPVIEQDSNILLSRRSSGIEKAKSLDDPDNCPQKSSNVKWLIDVNSTQQMLSGLPKDTFTNENTNFMDLPTPSENQYQTAGLNKMQSINLRINMMPTPVEKPQKFDIPNETVIKINNEQSIKLSEGTPQINNILDAHIEQLDIALVKPHHQNNIDISEKSDRLPNTEKIDCENVSLKPTNDGVHSNIIKDIYKDTIPAPSDKDQNKNMSPLSEPINHQLIQNDKSCPVKEDDIILSVEQNEENNSHKLDLNCIQKPNMYNNDKIIINEQPIFVPISNSNTLLKSGEISSEKNTNEEECKQVSKCKESNTTPKNIKDSNNSTIPKNLTGSATPPTSQPMYLKNSNTVLDSINNELDNMQKSLKDANHHKRNNSVRPVSPLAPEKQSFTKAKCVRKRNTDATLQNTNNKLNNLTTTAITHRSLHLALDNQEIISIDSNGTSDTLDNVSNQTIPQKLDEIQPLQDDRSFKGQRTTNNSTDSTINKTRIRYPNPPSVGNFSSNIINEKVTDLRSRPSQNREINSKDSNTQKEPNYRVRTDSPTIIDSTKTNNVRRRNNQNTIQNQNSENKISNSEDNFQVSIIKSENNNLEQNSTGEIITNNKTATDSVNKKPNLPIPEAFHKNHSQHGARNNSSEELKIVAANKLSSSDSRKSSDLSDNETVITPWGPMRKSPSRNSLRSPDRSRVIVNLSESGLENNSIFMTTKESKDSPINVKKGGPNKNEPKVKKNGHRTFDIPIQVDKPIEKELSGKNEPKVKKNGHRTFDIPIQVDMPIEKELSGKNEPKVKKNGLRTFDIPIKVDKLIEKELSGKNEPKVKKNGLRTFDVPIQIDMPIEKELSGESSKAKADNNDSVLRNQNHQIMPQKMVNNGNITNLNKDSRKRSSQLNNSQKEVDKSKIQSEKVDKAFKQIEKTFNMSEKETRRSHRKGFISSRKAFQPEDDQPPTVAIKIDISYEDFFGPKKDTMPRIEESSKEENGHCEIDTNHYPLKDIRNIDIKESKQDIRQETLCVQIIENTLSKENCPNSNGRDTKNEKQSTEDIRQTTKMENMIVEKISPIKLRNGDTDIKNTYTEINKQIITPYSENKIITSQHIETNKGSLQTKKNKDAKIIINHNQSDLGQEDTKPETKSVDINTSKECENSQSSGELKVAQSRRERNFNLGLKNSRSMISSIDTLYDSSHSCDKNSIKEESIRTRLRLEIPKGDFLSESWKDDKIAKSPCESDKSQRNSKESSKRNSLSDSDREDSSLMGVTRRKSRSGSSTGSAGSFRMSLFSAHDRISLFEKKTEDKPKRSPVPISRSKTSTLIGDKLLKVDNSNKLKRNSLYDHNKNTVPPSIYTHA